MRPSGGWELATRSLSARALLVGTVTVLALVVAALASPYLWQDPEAYSFVRQRDVYALERAAILAHIVPGILALVSGALQWIPIIRRNVRVHRCIGSVYVVAVTGGALAGLNAATFVFGGVSNTAAFGLLSMLWLFTTLNALRHILTRNVVQHRIWMIRSYALTFAAVTLRLQLGLLIGGFGLSMQSAYLIVPWSSWILNLIFAEWVIIGQARRPSPHRRRRAASPRFPESPPAARG